MIRAQEVFFFADRSLVDVVQLGHAVRRAEVFVAQDHDHVIGKPDSFHEVRDQVAWAQHIAVAENMPAVFAQSLAESIDDFRALVCCLGGIVAPCKRDENLRDVFGRKFWFGGNLYAAGS